MNAQGLSKSDKAPEANGKPNPTVARYLTPGTCKIHLGTHGALHVTVMNDRIYGGVFAAYAFPVAYPDKYISLIHSAGEDKEQIEIGIIRDLEEFPPEQVELVRQALRRRYFVHSIQAIKKIGWKYGFIAIKAGTDKGDVNFLMNWTTDRAVDYGRRGKILIDVNDNRYLIPDLDALDPKQLSDFQRYIYW